MHNSRIHIEISASALIFLAVMILTLPLKWLIAVLFAAAFHEFCHISTTVLLGGNIESITIGARGAVMKASIISVQRQLLASAAGPIGSLLLLFLAPWMPRTAVCGLIHGIYNLIPLMPLDGGRILKGILFSVLSPPKAGKVFMFLQRAVLICICVMCCIFVGKMSFILLAVMIFLFWWRHR